MECECRDAEICNDWVYGEVCVWLAERQRDCTIIDAGFGGMAGPHEVQRHLRRHGIEARTIGIDVSEYDAEVDEFIHADMRYVELPGVADVVICKHVLGFFEFNTPGFKKAVENCANWLKPDGLFCTTLATCDVSTDDVNARSWFLRFMSKDETREHAAQCHNMAGEQCPHGRELNLRVEERLDEELLMADLGLAKGVTLESILFDEENDPRQVDE